MIIRNENLKQIKCSTPQQKQLEIQFATDPLYYTPSRRTHRQRYTRPAKTLLVNSFNWQTLALQLHSDWFSHSVFSCFTMRNAMKCLQLFNWMHLLRNRRVAVGEPESLNSEGRWAEWGRYNEKERISKLGNELSTQMLNGKWKFCASLVCNEMKICVSCTQTPFQMQFYAMMPVAAAGNTTSPLVNMTYYGCCASQWCSAILVGLSAMWYDRNILLKFKQLYVSICDTICLYFSVEFELLLQLWDKEAG